MYAAPASYAPPRPPAPSYAAPPPGMLGAAHKPGAMPLRPLQLGNIYDAAFRIIRFNPKATVGSAALVTAVAMVIPILVSAVLAFTVGTGVDSSGSIDEDASTAEVIGFLGSIGSLVLGAYAAQLGIVFVTGMVAHVAHAGLNAVLVAEQACERPGLGRRLDNDEWLGHRCQPSERLIVLALRGIR